MFRLILALLFISTFAFSQTIVWEREYELGEPAVLSLIPTIIDSDTNIVILFDQYLTTTCFCPSFFKYDRNGTLLNYNKYETENYMLYPTAFEETNSSYRIFCG